MAITLKRAFVASKKRLHTLDDLVIIVDHVDELPFIESGAGVRDAEGEDVADFKRTVSRHIEKRMLIIQRDGRVAVT